MISHQLISKAFFFLDWKFESLKKRSLGLRVRPPHRTATVHCICPTGNTGVAKEMFERERESVWEKRKRANERKLIFKKVCRHRRRLLGARKKGKRVQQLLFMFVMIEV